MMMDKFKPFHMDKELIARAEIVIMAPVGQVWDALIRPEMIKQWLFGTNAVSDWREGSAIVYRGEWQGKAYEDKGVILKMIPGQIFSSTYWSGMSGLPDAPENYQKVTYTMAAEGDGTRLVVTQENIKTAEAQKHSGENWGVVLENLKNVLEK